MMRFKATFECVFPNAVHKGYSATFKANDKREAKKHCRQFENDNFGDYRLKRLKALSK